LKPRSANGRTAMRRCADYAQLLKSLCLDTSRQSAEHRCLHSGQVRRDPRAGKPRSLCAGTGDSGGGPLIGPKLSTHLPKAVARSSQFHRDERALAPAGSTLQRIGRRTCVEPTSRISPQKRGSVPRSTLTGSRLRCLVPPPAVHTGTTRARRRFYGQVDWICKHMPTLR